MLWITGILSTLKGMIKIPNIVGKVTADANTDLSNAHLINSGSTTENTGDTNLGGKVKSVNPVVDTLVDYESNVSYVSYVFSFTPFSVFGFSPFSVFGFSPFSVFSFTPSGYYYIIGPNTTSCTNVCGAVSGAISGNCVSDCGQACPVGKKCCGCPSGGAF
jgi:hypothetical protein